ncbi:nitrate/nitrite two-component system sensor histidine kinase NarQ [Vibrio pectenicida]|uniref:Sensor protein n=1 Tax=Vibrio pectenicida TaxID=62763 RepID=A0A427U3N6_9VIBR|nr:nitrate/nitrite two-component system sensor histidine kinase NarQ [Vibrio pectenicida]RSD31325.1 nitrate/nitrite two-component system sensor histidine kinase NarQ [Vibrio pectenicida]
MSKLERKSVTRIVAKAMILILMLSIAATSFAIATLSSSLNDAEAINVAGSMRMQSYRLAYDIKAQSNDFASHMMMFERSLYSPSMKKLRNWLSSDLITQDYDYLVRYWHQMKETLSGDSREEYLDQVVIFVEKIDNFVVKLQHFSEQKLIVSVWVGSIGLGSILTVSLILIHYVRKQIVKPLDLLIKASEQVQARSFDISLHVVNDNEIGLLTHTFNNMATELGKLYKGLEFAANEKTQKLQKANNSLQVLYRSSQELTTSRITQENLSNILKQLVNIEGIESVRLEIFQFGEKTLSIEHGVDEGSFSADQYKTLLFDEQELGSLLLSVSLPCPDPSLIENFVQMISRAIYYSQAQRKSEQLLLMEERATIARELHDSLAQALSYLKIQVSIIKKQMDQFPQSILLNKTNLTLLELDTGLSSAYTHLRELLTTFRLTIKAGGFGHALQEMVQQLRKQTQSYIVLNNELLSIEVEIHQQVHLLQIIRESTTNAIKHAQASQIDIHCHEGPYYVYVSVKDDGIGFEHMTGKVHHYGLNIIQERALCLQGKVEVKTANGKGCEISLIYPKTKEHDVDQM